MGDSDGFFNSIGNFISDTTNSISEGFSEVVDTVETVWEMPLDQKVELAKKMLISEATGFDGVTETVHNFLGVASYVSSAPALADAVVHLAEGLLNVPRFAYDLVANSEIVEETVYPRYVQYNYPGDKGTIKLDTSQPKRVKRLVVHTQKDDYLNDTMAHTLYAGRDLVFAIPFSKLFIRGGEGVKAVKASADGMRKVENAVANNTKNAVANNTKNAVANDAVNVVANDTGKAVANDAGKAVANDAGKAVANDTGKAVANDTGKAVAKDAEKAVANDAEKAVANDAGKAVANDAGKVAEQGANNLSQNGVEQVVENQARTKTRTVDINNVEVMLEKDPKLMTNDEIYELAKRVNFSHGNKAYVGNVKIRLIKKWRSRFVENYNDTSLVYKSPASQPVTTPAPKSSVSSPAPSAPKTVPTTELPASQPVATSAPKSSVSSSVPSAQKTVSATKLPASQPVATSAPKSSVPIEDNRFITKEDKVRFRNALVLKKLNDFKDMAPIYIAGYIVDHAPSAVLDYKRLSDNVSSMTEKD